jgi:protein phosphatase
MDICVDNANHSVFNASPTRTHAGMGTTLVVGLFRRTRPRVGHIGDSRCYRLRGQVLQHKDHHCCRSS